jgi:ribosome biogenesis GTPase
LIDLYGWTRARQQDFLPHAEKGFVPGRVILQTRGRYRLVTPDGETAAVLSGRYRWEADGNDYPVTGDFVSVQPVPGGEAVIHARLPRLSLFRRLAAGGAGTQAIAANADTALLAMSLNADLNIRRLERYLALTRDAGAQPVIVLTKADLMADHDAVIAQIHRAAGTVPVVALSALTGEGLALLDPWLLPGSTAVLLGSSGTGKSTLLNALAGETLMTTGEISAHLDKGRHTTTHRELVRLPSGALLLDTPGMRELGLVDASDGVSSVFADIEALAVQCRFRDCTHANEPGCAVRAAISAGDLDAGRFKSMRKLEREAAYEDRKEDPAARAAHLRYWKTIAKTHRSRTKARQRDEEGG